MKKIAIIGAGLTGLTTAYYLKKSGIQFTVFEKQNRTGGVIRTGMQNGFLFEQGPNSGIISNLETVELLDKLSDCCQFVTASKIAKKRLIWKDNKWEALPSGLLSAIKTPLFTVADKFKVLKEPFVKKGNNPDENLAEMVKRRLGKSFLDYAIDPFISGIYAGDTTYLIPKYALPKLYQLEQQYGSFIQGALKKRKTANSKISKEIFSTPKGLQGIIDCLTQEVETHNIRLNQTDLKINKTTSGYDINGEPFSGIVSTVSANILPELFPFLPEGDLKNITRLRYAKVVQIAVGFNRWEGIPLNAFGGLLPGKENRNLLGILFMSSLFKGRAPENGALLAVFAGGVNNEKIYDLTNEKIYEIVRDELQELFKIKNFNPGLFKIFKYPKAIAQYGLDSKERFESIRRIQNQNKGLYLGGSIIDGIGIPDRIKQAHSFALTISNEYE
jgi:oxygen-dependent protoporphyrinogen oxidase